MGTVKSCIFPPSEARAIAQGDASEMASLRDDICPALGQADAAVVQQQFAAATKSAPNAIAYLWRGDSVDAIRADRTPALNCEESATPLRCEAVVADMQGQASHLTAEHEDSVLGAATCD